MSRFLWIFVSAAALASAAETFPSLQLFKAPTTEQMRLQAMNNALQPSAVAKKGGLSHLSLTKTKPQMAKAENLCAIPLTSVRGVAKADLAMVHKSGASVDQSIERAPLMPACH